MPEHYRIYAAAYLILKREGKILLVRRYNTGFKDGQYSLPAGHLEKGEHPSVTIIRETKEEVGIHVAPEHLHLAHVSHRKSDGKEPREYADFFFLCEKWDGEPWNVEPQKCDDMKWFPHHELPAQIIGYVKEVLDHIDAGIMYSEK